MGATDSRYLFPYSSAAGGRETYAAPAPFVDGSFVRAGRVLSCVSHGSEFSTAFAFKPRDVWLTWPKFAFVP